ncbi:MAG: NAD(P)H-dependent oxidoreductase subunit E, partial [Paracoccaceae bacterium]|nr:NAD(P)H-dependent oxidoreductase subunit E [Paracoccaceae bacterium]
MTAMSTETPEKRALASADIESIRSICRDLGNDPARMMDILLQTQDRFRCISPRAMEVIAEATGLSRIAVEGVASFYAFFSETPKGQVTIRLCDDIVDRFAGLEEVVAAFEEALGIKVGETTADGAFSLEYTPCIGLCDQAPAAMINDLVLTRLTPARVQALVTDLQAGARLENVILDRFDERSPYERAT